MKRTAVALAIATLLISGCASFDSRSLVPGVATEADLLGALGKPTQTLRSDGQNVLYFSKTPLGRQTFVARVGPDGRLIGIEQVLDAQHFDRIRTGITTADQLKALLGPPSRIVRYAFKPLDVWEYPWRSGNQLRVLSVSVSDDGIVRDVSDTRDHIADGSWKN